MTTPDTEAAKWRRIADERLGKLAAIARIGAEPPDAVLAIIKGEETDTGGTATAYHHSVTDLRRELVRSAQGYRKASAEYFTAMHDRKREEVTDAERDAYMGTLMACNYSYVLAAILRVAEEELGPQSARRLATIADDMRLPPAPPVTARPPALTRQRRTWHTSRRRADREHGDRGHRPLGRTEGLPRPRDRAGSPGAPAGA